MAQTIELGGKGYVILEREEYVRLMTLAKADNLPPLPKPDANGNYPALEYARTSIARDIIRDRAEVGLTQLELAKLAGIREETLCRIETGKSTASVPTIEKIDRALNEAKQRKCKREGTRKRSR
jgi:DNA-binding XRE family transcriptional regulator